MDQGWERIGAVVEMKEQFKGKTCHCCLLSMMRVMMMWRRMTVMMIYLLEHLAVCEGYESSLMIMAMATTIIMAMSQLWLSENSHPVHSKIPKVGNATFITFPVQKCQNSRWQKISVGNGKCDFVQKILWYATLKYVNKITLKNN